MKPPNYRPLVSVLLVVGLAMPLALVPAASAWASAYSDQVIADGPVAYWRLGETSGTTATDVQSSYNGTYMNTPTLNQTGLIGGDSNKAPSFDGVSEYVNVGAPAPSGTGLTILAWIKPTSFNFAYGTIVSKQLAPTKTVLLVVPNAGSLGAQDSAKQTLIQGFGYNVSLLTASSSQATYDAAVAAANVAYVSNQCTATDVGTKLKSATIGVVNEHKDLFDDFGISSTSTTTTGQSLSITNTKHYIINGLSNGNIFTSTQNVMRLSGTLASGWKQLGKWGGADSLGIIETGGSLSGGGTAAGRRVELPWGQSTFDINTLTAMGQTIMQRAIAWACAPKVLFIAKYSGGSMTALDTGRLDWFTDQTTSSMGYQVDTIQEADTQSTFDTEAAKNDVAYISEQVNSGNVGTKPQNFTIGVVNEEVALADTEFGIYSGSGTYTGAVAAITNSHHFITNPYSTGSLTVFTSSQPLYTLAGTPAPGLVELSQLGGLPSMQVLEQDAPLYTSGTAPGRRVQLFMAGNNLDYTTLNTAGHDITDRAIRWAAAKPNHYWTLSTAPYNGSTYLRFVLRTSGGTTTLLDTTTPLATGATVMVTATYDGATMKLYKNSTLIASVAKTGTVTNGSSVPVWIGNSPEAAAGTAWGNPFNGIIDEPAIFNRALTAAEVQDLFTKGSTAGVHITKWLEIP